MKSGAFLLKFYLNLSLFGMTEKMKNVAFLKHILSLAQSN